MAPLIARSRRRVNARGRARDTVPPCGPRGFACSSCRRAGARGSKACSTYAPGDGGDPDKFTVTISWNAAGGNAYVDYVLAYGPQGEFNSSGILGGGPNNICTSGPV